PRRSSGHDPTHGCGTEGPHRDRQPPPAAPCASWHRACPRRPIPGPPGRPPTPAHARSRTERAVDALPAPGALVRMARTRARPPALPRARSVTITRARLVALSVVIPICHVASLDARAQQVAHDASTAPAARSGAELYRDACAACHGVDGTGQPRSVVGFDLPLPDFTDCSFATREPDADWFAVVHEGGGVRGFHRMMPAFGEALTDEEIQRTLDYIRTLCEEADEWPRGELNLPRALVTEKAY